MHHDARTLHGRNDVRGGRDGPDALPALLRRLPRARRARGRSRGARAGTAPTDLTQIAAAHGGQFPLEAVVEAIDGTRTVRAHGVSEMPVWGEVFRADHPRRNISSRCARRSSPSRTTCAPCRLPRRPRADHHPFHRPRSDEHATTQFGAAFGRPCQPPSGATAPLAVALPARGARGTARVACENCLALNKVATGTPPHGRSRPGPGE